ncbi:MAG: phage major capsid protein [Verrucomicrobia bacterium]|nr:phage major capsid protein [Verrucomicrobiota bacterium]
MNTTTTASPSPYSVPNIICGNNDPLRAMRRSALTELVGKEAGGTCELIFPNHRNLAHNASKRDLEFSGSVFDEARPVLMLEDELRPHSNLIKAGARVLDLGPSPQATQLTSIDPALLAGWVNTPELAATTPLCVLTPWRLSCLINFSKTLLKMQPDLTIPFVERQIFSAMAGEMERAALLGTGTNEPVGLLTEPLVVTLDLPVGEAAFAEAEQLISEAYLENSIHVLTSPLVRKNQRSLQREPNVWGDPLPRSVSPHLATAGNNAGQIAVVGSFPDLIIGTWGGIKLQSNPYSRSPEGFISALAEIWVDIISLRTGSFKIINPATVL